MKLPRGSLPVFSVADEEEAKYLLTMACPRTMKGEFVAEELVEEQTLENLHRFSHRLALFYDIMKETGQCRCKT